MAKEINVGDQVAFQHPMGSLSIVGVVKAVGRVTSTVVVVEEYASSVWGESREGSGNIHIVDLKDLREVAEWAD